MRLAPVAAVVLALAGAGATIAVPSAVTPAYAASCENGEGLPPNHGLYLSQRYTCSRINAAKVRYVRPMAHRAPCAHGLTHWEGFDETYTCIGDPPTANCHWQRGDQFEFCG